MGPRRFLFLNAIATTLLLVAAPFLPAQSPPAVRCDVLVGFNGTVREGRFAPVVLSVENPGARLKAEIAERNSYDYVIHSGSKEQDFRALLEFWTQAQKKLVQG